METRHDFHEQRIHAPDRPLRKIKCDSREKQIREIMERARKRDLQIVPPWLLQGGPAVSFSCLDEQDQRWVVTRWVAQDTIPPSLRINCPTV